MANLTPTAAAINPVTSINSDLNASGPWLLIDTDKGQIRVAELKKNGFFGETAILCDAPRNATIKANESLLTLKISKDMFYSLVAEVPQMAIEVMRELAHRVEETNKKLSEATAKLAA